MTLQIVEKSGEGLSRVYGVTIPAGDLAAKLEARIVDMAPKMNVKGFRPGKVPAAHVRRLYGKSLMSEVLEETLNETSKQVLDDNNLRPAGQPELNPTSDIEKVLDGGADLSYDLSVEVMPDFEPVDPKTLTLSRPVYKPGDEEVDEAVAELAKQARTYAPRTGKSLKAKDGDQLLIDFSGSIDGVKFDGGTAEDAELTLGSGQFIPGFEEQLVGVKPGDEKIVKVTFPADYQAENLKGKDAEFAVTVKEVRAPEDAAADDSLAQRLGLSDLAGLKDALRSNIEQRYNASSRFKLKRALLDVLDEKHDFPLPPRMVDAEFAGIWQQVEQDKTRGGLPAEDADKSEEQLKTEYRKIAERRVRLGLVLAEIGRKNEVAVTDQEMNDAIRREAMQYGAQAQQVFDMYRQRPDLQASVRAPLYEDKVVDLIFDRATVEDTPVSKDELLADDDVPEGY
jgi:trigger factor